MRPRLLVVEDDEMLREMLHETLSTRGLDVVVAANPSDGLQFAAAHEIDAVLTDLDLAGYSGLDFCQHLNRQNAALGRVVPIWVMTGSDDPEVSVRALAIGAQGVLRKPFKVQLAHECLVSSLQKSLPNQRGAGGQGDSQASEDEQ